MVWISVSHSPIPYTYLNTFHNTSPTPVVDGLLHGRALAILSSGTVAVLADDMQRHLHWGARVFMVLHMVSPY